MVGGNRITNYRGEVRTIKFHWNSALSTPGAKWTGMDISKVYLNTKLDLFDYIRIHIKDITKEVIDECNLTDKVAADGFVYIKIQGAIYGLAQTGQQANKELNKVVGAECYYPSKYTAGLYLHKARPISFTLVVVNFGVKYINIEEAIHLEKNYIRKIFNEIRFERRKIHRH